ncbi:MAG: glycerol-3-phosphate 1-O-acyltransferase PlsY, partial [Gemmatimonadales bacterium]|nr:glycerol-3-phosphate 1-O-acyltransferase PlsY [Gemmatimonadales bacterium]
PSSYLIARAKGVDLRREGSGNLGATNLYRVMGWKYAVPSGLFDIAKGTVAVLAIAPMARPSILFGLAAGFTAMLGHMFSPFVGFKGGKGVATAAGVVLALSPLAFGIALVVWAGLVAATGYVSVASIGAAVVYPVAVYLSQPARRSTIWFDIALAALIIWMHRSNIGRLLSGTENRFGRRGRAEATGSGS